MKDRNVMRGKTIGIVLLLPALICGCRRDSQLQVYETIQEAAEKGDLADVERHLKRGANVNDKNYEQRYTSGLTALHLAAGNGHKEVVELLIRKGAVVNAKAEDDIMPLHWAVVKGFNDVRGDHKGVIELLITKGADVNARTEANRGDAGTPLHFALHTKRMDKEVIALLIAKGADVNAKDASGKTPLHWATSSGDEEVIEFLILKGANVNAEDDRGATPLDRISGIKDYESIVELLKKHGARGKT